MLDTIVADLQPARRLGRRSQSRSSRPRAPPSYAGWRMPPHWIWMQVAIVVFVLIGMIVAITKLA
jgi:hypothetical protein